MITAGGGSGNVGDVSVVGDAPARSSIITTNSEQPKDYIDANDSDLRARIDRITDTIESSNSTSTTSNRNKRSRCSSGNNGNDSRKGSQQQLSANFFSYPSYRATAATAAAVGGGGIHNRAPSNHVLRQELSLLNLLNFLCDRGDMDIPVNDPSLFQPTPFAPGEDAHTLQLEQQRVHEPVVPTVIVLASVPVPVAGTRLVAKVPVQVPVAIAPPIPLPVSVPLPIPAAATAALVAEVPLPVSAVISSPLAPAMPTTTIPLSQFLPSAPDQSVLSLLQQLCAANFFGGPSSSGSSSSSSNNTFFPQSPPLSLPFARQADQIVPSQQSAFNNVQPIVWNPSGGGFDLNQLLISAGLVAPPSLRLGIGNGIELLGDNAGNSMNASINNNINRMMLMQNPILPTSSSLPFTTTTAIPSSTVLPDTNHNNAVRTVSLCERPVKSRPPSDAAAAATTTSSRGTDKKPKGGKGTIKNRERRWMMRYNELLEVNSLPLFVYHLSFWPNCTFYFPQSINQCHH